jgi:hypothetical protein
MCARAAKNPQVRAALARTLRARVARPWTATRMRPLRWRHPACPAPCHTPSPAARGRWLRAAPSLGDCRCSHARRDARVVSPISCSAASIVLNAPSGSISGRSPAVQTSSPLMACSTANCPRAPPPQIERALWRLGARAPGRSCGAPSGRTGTTRTARARRAARGSPRLGRAESTASGWAGALAAFAPGCGCLNMRSTASSSTSATCSGSPHSQQKRVMTRKSCLDCHTSSSFAHKRAVLPPAEWRPGP